jgi:hypothetical protein
MQDLVNVLRATGMRKPPGSATEFNRQLNHELALPPISAEIAAAAKTGRHFRFVGHSRSSEARVARPWNFAVVGTILGTR